MNPENYISLPKLFFLQLIVALKKKKKIASHSAGYEKYNSMRADSTLCFLERVGMPDAKAIAAEQRGTDMLADGGDG